MKPVSALDLSSHLHRGRPVSAPPPPDEMSAIGRRTDLVRDERRRGRGAISNRSGRFEHETRIETDDGWSALDALEPFTVQVTAEKPRTIITRNESPDISFDRSINPYRGCEHGCVYCFARPTHAYMGLSAGLDFETQLFFKAGAADLLRRELSAPNYQPKTIAIGSNTDPYQPIERRCQVTRSILEVLSETNHPVGIVTKSASVLRDIDLLAAMAKKRPREGRSVDHDAGSKIGSRDGAARFGAQPSPRGHRAIVRGGRADHRDGRANYSRGE